MSQKHLKSFLSARYDPLKHRPLDELCIYRHFWRSCTPFADADLYVVRKNDIQRTDENFVRAYIPMLWPRVSILWSEISILCLCYTVVP